MPSPPINYTALSTPEVSLAAERAQLLRQRAELQRSEQDRLPPPEQVEPKAEHGHPAVDEQQQRAQAEEEQLDRLRREQQAQRDEQREQRRTRLMPLPTWYTNPTSHQHPLTHVDNETPLKPVVESVQGGADVSAIPKNPVTRRDMADPAEPPPGAVDPPGASARATRAPSVRAIEQLDHTNDLNDTHTTEGRAQVMLVAVVAKSEEILAMLDQIQEAANRFQAELGWSPQEEKEECLRIDALFQILDTMMEQYAPLYQAPAALTAQVREFNYFS